MVPNKAHHKRRDIQGEPSRRQSPAAHDVATTQGLEVTDQPQRCDSQDWYAIQVRVSGPAQPRRAARPAQAASGAAGDHRNLNE